VVRPRSGRLISSLRPRPGSLSARSRHPRPTIFRLAATASMAALQAVARCARSATATMDPGVRSYGSRRLPGTTDRTRSSSISISPRRTPDQGPRHRSTGSHAGSHPHERPPARPDGFRQQPGRSQSVRTDLNRPAAAYRCLPIRRSLTAVMTATASYDQPIYGTVTHDLDEVDER